MKLHLLVTLTVIGVVFLSGQALAAENSGLSPIEATIQRSTERGLTDTAWAKQTAGTQDVRSYFGSQAYDIDKTIESSKENGGGRVVFAEPDEDRDVRPYFGETDAPDIDKTIESSTEKGLY